MSQIAAAPEDGAHLRTCPLCESMCGLRVEVENGEVQRIRGNDDDVWSRGYICPKGTALGQLHHDPDRLRGPLVRHGGTWSQVSWEEAYAEVWRRLQPVLERDGISAVTTYVGNPVAHFFSLSRYIGAFIPMSGIQPLYSAGTVDQWPKNLVCALLYGSMWSIPLPDLDRNDFLLMLGANPHASQGSLLAAADVLGRIDAIRAHGGRVVVVDPRRTGTAERADEWIGIQPGTDAALLLAMANVLFAEGGVRLGHLKDRVAGLGKVERLARDFTPEAVEGCCRVPAETIRRLAHQLSNAGRGAVYGRIGICTQEFGTLASWLVEVLNVLTGNLDREGGSMFANPIAWSLTSIRPPEFAEGFEFGRFRSRVRGAPEVLGQFPLSCLAEEIATPGEGQIKALLTIAGNPVLSAPDAARLDAALPGLECMVSVDNYLNETTRHAHVILPGLSPLEQPHYDELVWSWALRNAGKYSPALFAPPPDHPQEWRILLTLTGMLQGVPPESIVPEQVDQLFFAGLVATVASQEGSVISGRDPGDIVAQAGEPGPERILDFAIRTGPWGDAYGARPDGLTLEHLKRAPNGIDLGALTPRLGEVLQTTSGRIELAPEHICADIPRLRERLSHRPQGLVLVSRRHVRSNNSWMHNIPALMTGRQRCTLLIHPDDATQRGLADGGLARIRSQAGSVEVMVEVSDQMLPGVVSLPHGWGHDKPGTRLSVAREHAGVCSNLLTPGTLLDAPSNNAVVNGIPVEVEAA